jgi:hypothetical protein
MAKVTKKKTSKGAKGSGSTRERKWIPAFLAALSSSANVTLACTAARIARSKVYEYRDKNPQFAKQWEDAMDTAIDILEEEARRRAQDGVETFVVSKGQVVMWEGKPLKERKYSDTLMVALLKAHRPAKYRENFKLEHAGPDGGPVQVEVKNLPNADLSQLAIALAASITSGSSNSGAPVSS